MPGEILTGGKDDVAADGVGERVHRRSRLGGPRISVNPDAAEVLPEARLEELA